MIKINLLPKEIQERGKGVEWVIFGGALIGACAVIAISSYFLQLHGYKQNLKKKERWSAQLAEIKAKVAQVEQLDSQKSLLNAKKNTVVQLLQGRLLYPKLMEAVFETLPREVWVSDLTLSEDGQKNVKISANSISLTIDAIADWLQTLESKPERFTGVTISAIDVKDATPEQRGLPTYIFSMTFTYVPPPAGA